MEPLESVTSPLFPQQALSSDTALKLPSKPLAHSGSVQLYLLLAENILYIQGFEESEYKERPPALLRGSLFLRITKPVKIKSISLKFAGVAKTDWPEGIPPKKSEFQETNHLISHTWPFFNASQPSATEPNKGAHIFRSLDEQQQQPHASNSMEEISSFSLEPVSTSNTMNNITSMMSNNTTHNIQGSLASVLRRAASPSPANVPRSRSNTAATNSGTAVGGNFLGHLSLTGNSNNSLDTTVSNDLQSVKSVDTMDQNTLKTFQPGDYIYTFELPIPASTPESMNVTFGNVQYYLEASVERSGAFKTSLLARETVTVIRTPSDSSLEENEPIAIIRDWEDKLKYEIVIASKSVVLNTYLPLAFKLIPLQKVQLHRIRVYLTENLEYYCRHKKVHRMEPQKKYLLLEHKPKEGENNLLGQDEITSRELEFQVYVPERLNEKQKFHPDTSYQNIQSHHWIKICLRLSKPDPTEESSTKRKHYEISIDSPLHVLSPLATRANTLLPSYTDSPHVTYQHDPLPMSPDVIPVDYSLDAVMSASSTQLNQIHYNPDMNLDSNIYKPGPLAPELQSPQAQPFSPIVSPEMAALSPNLHALSSPGMAPTNSPNIMSRPIHLLRRPSNNPPPFDAEAPPPTIDGDEPPAYEESESGSVHGDQEAAPELTGPETDIGHTFEFRGISPELPGSVARSKSPLRSQSRSTSQLRHVTNSSDMLSQDFNQRNPSYSNNANSHAPAPRRVMPHTAESLLNDFMEDDPVYEATPSSLPVATTHSPSALNSLSPHLDPLSPTSSVASSQQSQETELGAVGEPLLNTMTTSTNSTATYDRPPIGALGRGRTASRISTDIASMYMGNNNTDSSLHHPRTESIWHPLESDFSHINHPHLFKKPQKVEEHHRNAAPHQDPSGRHMSFGVEEIKSTTSALPESHSLATITDQTMQDKPAPPAPRKTRPSATLMSETPSLNSNNSNGTLRSENSAVHSHDTAPVDSTVMQKISSTSSSRPALEEPEAY